MSCFGYEIPGMRVFVALVQYGFLDHPIYTSDFLFPFSVAKTQKKLGVVPICVDNGFAGSRPNLLVFDRISRARCQTTKKLSSVLAMSDQR